MNLERQIFVSMFGMFRAFLIVYCDSVFSLPSTKRNRKRKVAAESIRKKKLIVWPLIQSLVVAAIAAATVFSYVECFLVGRYSVIELQLQHRLLF